MNVLCFELWFDSSLFSLSCCILLPCSVWCLCASHSFNFGFHVTWKHCKCVLLFFFDEKRLLLNLRTLDKFSHTNTHTHYIHLWNASCSWQACWRDDDLHANNRFAHEICITNHPILSKLRTFGRKKKITCVQHFWFQRWLDKSNSVIFL